MTGHMVLSTLHTIDAASAIGRLADMGVDMSALAGALRAVIAQRLVRRLCKECSEPISASQIPSQIAWCFDGHDTSKIRRAVGCAACRGTGYRGRMVIAEMLVIDSETQQLMARSTRRLEFLQLARKSGMHTLWETGLGRVLDGLTSCEELVDNITPPIPDVDLQQEDVDRLLTDLLENQSPPSATGTATPGVALDAPPTAMSVNVEPGAPARGHPPRPHHADNHGAWSRLVIAPRAHGDGRPRVLVADDDAERRRALRKALERANCVVIEVNDGEAALSYACRLRPDVVITEVALKRLDGIGLLQALVLESVVAHVFVYTDQRDVGLLAWARELGARDALTTENDVEMVAARVRAELGKKQSGSILRVS
jgi:CheY-like chemotaxis protein